MQRSLGIPRLINALCDAAFVYGCYADDVKVISRDLIEAVAKARNLGVKRNDLDAALPEEQEKGEGGHPEPQAWLLKELEGRLCTLELQLASQGESFLNIRKELEARNGRPDERDKIIIMLFRMLKKSLGNRVKLVKQIEHLEKEQLTHEKKQQRSLS